MEKPKRPKSVSAISWILIVRNFIPFPSLPILLYGYIREPHLLDNTYVALGPIRVAPTYVVLVSMLVVPILIYITVVIALFKGYNWGRLLYLVYNPIWILAFCILPLINILIHGFSVEDLVIRIVRLCLEVTFYIFALVFLSRPAALAFFAYRRPGKQL